MSTIPNVTAVEGFDDASDVRVVLFQSGRFISVPVDGFGLQPLDATLTALAAFNTNGFLVQTAADTFAGRTLTTTANHLSITNPEGTAGNPLLELAVGPLLVGTWTPTLTNVANVAASTSAAGHYIRVGTKVFCFNQISIDPTAAAPTTTTLGISLPVASNLGAATDLSGVGVCASSTNTPAVIYGDAANNRAELQFAAGNLANVFWTFVFGYTVI